MAGFLPYGGGASGLWSGSFVFSISAHAAMTAGLYALYTTAPPPPPLEERTAFTVTLQELDTETLAGTLQETPAPPDADGSGEGSDGDADEGTDVASDDPDEGQETTETTAVETPDPVEVETAEAVESTDPDVVDPEATELPPVETPELAEVDTIEQVTPTVPEDFQSADVIEVPDVVGTPDGIIPDTAVAVEIDSIATASTVVDQVAPVAPIAPASPVLAPAEVNPISPLAEASPLAPDIAAPVQGVDTGSTTPISPIATTVAPVGTAAPTTTVTSVGTALDPVAPLSPGGDVPTQITPVAPDAQQVAAVTTAPPQSADPTPVSANAAAPSAQDLRLGELINQIRATPSGERCLIALPRRDGEDGVGLSIISASEIAMETYAQTLLTPEYADIPQTRTLIDQRQCAALSYIAASGDYPATRMGISTEFTEIPSGENFTGVLRGAAGRFLTLLVIDDNGVVQDLQRFMSFSANLARFDVPVNRAGPPRDTKQILLAIATRRQPTEIREEIGRLAEDVFGGLPADLTQDAALGFLTFDVR